MLCNRFKNKYGPRVPISNDDHPCWDCQGCDDIEMFVIHAWKENEITPYPRVIKTRSDNKLFQTIKKLRKELKTVVKITVSEGTSFCPFMSIEY